MQYIADDLDMEAWAKAGLARLEPYLASWRGVHTYVTAVTDALHPVFLAAAGAALGLTWFLRELPLRATAHGPGQPS